MASMLSAGVQVREWDLSNVVPGVSTTEVGFAGMFSWGPVEERILIGSEDELLDVFGKPDSVNYEDWFSAADFLSYGNKLWNVRVVDEISANTAIRAKNATSANTSGYLVRNRDEYDHKYYDGSLQSTYGTGPWIARYPGALGNTLKVSICPSASAYQSTLTGTVTISANTSTISGANTTFTTQLSVGDLVVVNNETLKISSVVSNTSATATTRHVAGASAVSAVRRWEYYNEVSVAPGTSNYGTTFGASNDEMHIVVVDEDGLFTNQPNSVLEVYQKVSKASDAKLDGGEGNYYRELIRQKSKYIHWAGHSALIPNIGKRAQNTTFAEYAKPISFSLTGGKDGALIGNAEKIRGFNMFKDKNISDISIIIGGNASQTVITHIVNNILEKRKNTIAFFSPPKSYVVNNAGNEAVDVVNFRNTLPVTSYAGLDCNWKSIYDQYNDIYRYIPCNSSVAGANVKTDEEKDTWYAAAGFNNGQVKNVIKLAWNPTEEDRDILYKNNINPIVTFPGDGTVIYGQKTMLTKPSAFDRLNVRRLFITAEKAISKAARYILWEFNDEFTRTSLVNMIDPYLREIKGRRGIYDYYIRCDEKNNTPEIIDKNILICDIFIKPARTAEFIQINFIATRTGDDFTEIAANFHP